MAETLRANDAQAVEEAIRWALSAGEPLEVVGGGTKRQIAPPGQTGYVLDVSQNAGIVAYEPEELVLTLRPGTPMAEVGEALAAAGQMFAFEPPDYKALLEGDGEATFGGAYGTNFSGPRRLAAGAVRDHMLGVHAVSGRGESFKAGGRVVKNVTGYDLARALCGSWGTLAVATELTVKVLPRPQTEVTLAYRDLDAEQAVALMARAMGSAGDVSGAAHAGADVASALGLGAEPATLLRLEGFGPSVEARASALTRELGACERVEAEASRPLWAAIRDAQPFVGAPVVWRCSVTPSAGPAVGAAAPPGSRVLFDWAGGLVLIEAPAEGDGGAAAIRRAIADAGGGHATLLKAPVELRGSVPTFHPTGEGLRALAERLRKAFDPQSVLNPSRLSRS